MAKAMTLDEYMVRHKRDYDTMSSMLFDVLRFVDDSDTLSIAEFVGQLEVLKTQLMYQIFIDAKDGGGTDE